MVAFLRKLFILSCIAVLALPLSPASAQIAPPAKPDSQVIIMDPLTIVKVRDLNFGDLIVTGAGTATIDPVSLTLATSGGVLPGGSSWSAARFAGFAQGSAVVNIKVPRKALTLTRVGGPETLVVDDWTLDGQAKRTLAASGAFQFDVGATATVAADQAEGIYTAEFDVTIQYP